ncbi:methyl-accepting chemotaxis protein [Clostridium sp. MD294]|uniref:methyl-accepting chemotaxis protein n=1 Tax=Clostridium sp. MD294 TaxID=97138 RepID=UPI00039DF3D8|nr:methyl-accepting chemotaxis protein [Clostridium sp. MD294]NDO46568.1 methyl-accepting chemotaxis protein [Clostridium sp. MD294]
MKMKKKFISLHFKMLGGILLPNLIVCVLMGMFITNSVGKSTQGLIVERLSADAIAVSNEANEFFSQHIAKVETIAADCNIEQLLIQTLPNTALVDAPLFPSVQQTVTKQQQVDSDTVLSVFIADVDSSQFMMSDGYVTGPNYDIASRPWYEAVTSNKTFITLPYTDINTGEIVVTIASPITETNTSNVIGVAAIDMSLESIVKIMDNYIVGDTGFLVCMGPAGTILYHPNSAYINQNFSETDFSSDMKSAVANSAFDDYTFNIDNTEYYGSLTEIGDTGFMVLTCMPEDEAMSVYKSITKQIDGAFFISLIIMAICVFILSKMIIRPLMSLRNAAQSIAEGNLNITMDTHSSDEIGQVSIAFSKTVEQLKKYIVYIDEIASVLSQISLGNLVFSLQNDYTGEFSKIKDSLLDIRTNLTTTLSHVSNSSDKVLENSMHMADNALALAQGATEQASAVEQLAASLNDVSHHVEASAQRAENANQQAIAVGEHISVSDKKMKEVLYSIQHINEFSSQIEAIIKTIEDIAFQTNILALNAAVEAARAGTAGKGFAVVADEVRNLAGKSAEAAKNTTQLIIQTIDAVADSTKIAHTAASAMNEVVVGANSIIAELNEISKMSLEQSHAISQITIGIEQISSVVSTNSASAEETSAAVNILSSQAKVMEKEIKRFQLS